LGLVAYAATMQGKPYVSGGSAPELGFDCSGLVYHVFRQFDLTVPRSAREMAVQLPSISLSAIEAADLLFFDTQGQPYSHVGIYLGDGRFVHAPSPKTGRVIISRMSNRYWRARLTGARRIDALNIKTASIPDFDSLKPFKRGSM
jgi:cell wall-associated NlpC family hydrolase